MKWSLLLGMMVMVYGCGQDQADSLLDDNPEYAGKPDTHDLPMTERRELLRQRLLKVQTDR